MTSKPDSVAARRFAEFGIRVLPLHSPDPSSPTGCDCRKAKCDHPAKHPRTQNGVKNSSSDRDQIDKWWRMWPTANLAIDLASANLLDVAPDSLKWLEEFQRRGLPRGAAAWQSGSGEGHAHFLFRRPEGCPPYRLCWPDEYDILTNGYSIVPPSVNLGGPYIWLKPLPERLEELPEAPAWVVEMLRTAMAKTASPPSQRIEHTAFEAPPVALGPRALKWWSGEQFHLKADGDVDRSETLFTIGLCLASGGANEDLIGAAVADRDRTLGYLKYADRRDGGDLEYSRIAAKAKATSSSSSGPVDSSRSPPRTTGGSGASSRLKSGGSAILDCPLETPALWGEGEAVLAAQGEATMIYGPTGIGKGTLSQQLVLASIGVRPAELLGLPVAPRKHWLYLALDRPAEAQASGLSLHAEGAELVVRYQGDVPGALLEELRQHKAEVLALLVQDNGVADPTACRGCGEVIPGGTTLCATCGSARSPLVRYALELAALANERSLRGRALIALDKRRYPRLQLRAGEKVGPGLIAWCPVLREADAKTLETIIALADRTPVQADDRPGVQRALEDRNGWGERP